MSRVRTLKYRYSGFILGTLLLLCGAGWGVSLLVFKGYYLLALLGLAGIYLVMFSLGRTYGRIYFVLASIKYMKSKGGSLARSDLQQFFEAGVSRRKSPAEAREFGELLIELLVSEGVVTCAGESVVLTEV